MSHKPFLILGILIGVGLVTFSAYSLMDKEVDQTASSQPMDNGYASAIFAGGCFWCMEPPYDKLDGVISTTSGYIGGDVDNPTYQQVSAGYTGHTEALEVLYDPKKVTYQELLDIFWVNIDPTVKDRQFCDGGNQYRTGIFYHDEEEKALAEAHKQKLIDSGRFNQVVTEITAASTFYPAEEYHQDYYMKNPVRYKYYRYSCGRDNRLEELWGDAYKK
jgi:peptide-methionine (S)-S-oxide reductase